MAGQTATLSVNLANSVLTTVTWTASYANTADTFGTIGTPTKTQIATGTFTVTSTLTQYTTNISIPAAATTGIEILFTVGAQTSGTWQIGNVQLEAGSVATPYERQIYSDQLAQCQRYFATFGGSSAYEFFAVGLANSNNTGYFSLVLPTTMRSTPSLGYSAFSDICIGYTAGGATVTNNVYIGQNSKQIIYVVATVATTPLTGGWALTLQANNTTNARLTFSAEL